MNVTAHMQGLLDKLAQQLGLRNPRFDVEPGVEKGENWSGVLLRVTVRSDDKDPVKVVLKSTPQNAMQRMAMKCHLTYRNEVNVYTVVLPAFLRLLQDGGVLAGGDVYPGTVRCLLTHLGDGDDSEDALLLQDIRAEGFRMLDKRVGLDAARCREGLRFLGRFHAASIAMQHLRPTEFQRVKEAVSETQYDSPEFAQFVSRLAGIVTGALQGRFKERPQIIQRVSESFANFQEVMRGLTTPDPEGPNVICHGDCWLNNCLFREDDKGEPQFVMLDWQIARYAAPAVDVSHFLFFNTTREVRSEHLDGLLRAYHEALSERLRALGCDPSALYPWQRFQQQLQQRALYGVLFSMVGLPALLAGDMGIDMEVGSGDFIHKAMTWAKAQAQVLVTNHCGCVDRIADIVEDAVRVGYLVV